VRRRFAVLVAVVAVAAPAFIMLTSSSAGAQFRFSFTEHLTNFEATVNGQRTLNPATPPGPGDSFFLRNDLLQNGVVVGFDNIQCTVTFNDNTICSGVAAFTNKGDIVLTGLLRDGATLANPKVFDAAVTGGTFLYRNAHGDAHAVVNGFDVNWTVNFVTQ
jgi:hypothetical protein